MILLFFINYHVLSQSMLANTTGIRSIGLLAFTESDTAYYESGEVKSVCFYTNSVHQVKLNSTGIYEKQKIEYHYDKCGNLRSIVKRTKVTDIWYKKIESCWSSSFNRPFEITENIIPYVFCREPWTKPHQSDYRLF